MRSYEDFLKGKRVSIIGGAAKWDERADEADVVVRINQHVIESGGRADVIYDAMTKEASLFFERRTIEKMRWWMMCKNGTCYQESLRGRARAHGVKAKGYTLQRQRDDLDEETFCYDEQWLQREMWRYDCVPLTGIIALIHITRADVRSVFLTGMNFYADNGTVPAKRDSHDIEKNRQIVRDTLRIDKRVRGDKMLLESLELPTEAK